MSLVIFASSSAKHCSQSEKCCTYLDGSMWWTLLMTIYNCAFLFVVMEHYICVFVAKYPKIDINYC